MTEPTDPLAESIEEFSGLDGLLEHRVRLAICVLLSAHDALSFSWLKHSLRETDGNLGAHLRRLEEAGYLSADKTFRQRRPVTWYRLSDEGRSSLQLHIESLTNLLGRADSDS